MSEINDGGAAFPRPQAETSLGGNFEQDGMSLRDWFAGQALAGYLASFAGLSSVPDGEAAAIKAYAYADAMIAARKGGAE